MLTKVVTGLISSGLLLTAQAAFADNGNHYGHNKWRHWSAAFRLRVCASHRRRPHRPSRAHQRAPSGMLD